MGGEILPPGDLQRPLDQRRIIGGAHVGEPRPEGVVVEANQRIAVHQVDVVLDHDDVAGGVVRIHPPASVRDDQQFRPRAFITRTGNVTCL